MIGSHADQALAILEIDENGLDEMDKRILETLFVKFGGGPAGLNSLAVAVGEALERCPSQEIWEFGAGTGALAHQMLSALGHQIDSYHIIDVSGSLRQRQQDTLQAHADRVHWHDEWPDGFSGVVVANDTQGDILQALVALGYSDKEAQAALKALPPDVSVSDGIKQALKALAR